MFHRSLGSRAGDDIDPRWTIQRDADPRGPAERKREEAVMPLRRALAGGYNEMDIGGGRQQGGEGPARGQPRRALRLNTCFGLSAPGPVGPGLA